MAMEFFKDLNTYAMGFDIFAELRYNLDSYTQKFCNAA